MSVTRIASYTVAILALLALIAWGAFQITAQEDGPDAVDSDAAFADAVSRAKAEVDGFVTGGGDACTLDRGEPAGLLGPGYPSLEALINDVDLVIEGDLVSHSLERPREGTAAARVLSTVIVKETLAGEIPDGKFTLEARGRVVLRGGDPARVPNLGFDQCTTDRSVLFLHATDDPETFELAANGFYTINGQNVDPGRSSVLFASALSNESLKVEIREIASDQADREIPKGRLICELRLGSEIFQDPFACPGDTYNPYEVYGLARLLEVDAQRYDGDGQVIAERGDVPIDSDEVTGLFALFDSDFTLTPGRRPSGNMTKVKALTTTTGSPPVSAVLEYYPEADLVWIELSGASIVAPEGVRDALDRILQVGR